jgi:uncharacterized protein (DUF849 family)
MSPHLPVTPDEIADQAVEAAQAGAAILHLHARNPETGQPTADPAVFMQFLPRIKSECDAVINITTGGSSLMTLEERLAAPNLAQPEMASLNMGSMNFGLFPMKRRHDEWLYDWEPKLLDATREVVFKNSFADIEQIFSQLGEGHGTRFVAFYLREGLIKKPVFVQFVLGVLGGIDSSPESLMHMKATADRLLGDNYQFSVLSAGRLQIPLATIGAILGGNVRVGLEDSLLIGRGKLAQSNAEQVRKIRLILEELGYEIATPEDTREMLNLKGADKVNF